MVKKISNTEVGIVSPITGYSDGKEANATASQFVKIFPARVVGAVSLPSSSLYVDDFDPEDLNVADDDAESESGQDSEDDVSKKAPTLADIELVSNSVVYDAANNPTATVIFKVRNSSNETVKADNARVKVL